MRVRMGCTLSVSVVVLAWASSPAAAQVNPPATKSRQSSSGRISSAPKLSESAKNAAKMRVRLYSFSQNIQPDILRRLERPLLPTDAVAVPSPTCAHILIYAAPQNADARMVIEFPDDYDGPTPALRALPPCSRDFRPRFFIAQIPPPRFMKPARTDALPPDSERRPDLLPPE